MALLTRGTGGRYTHAHQAQALVTAQQPRPMFATILASVERPPAPLRPPRRAVGETDWPRVADAMIVAVVLE